MVDAVVVGSGPNGLAAAITLARAGRSVVVLESGPTAGGGVRSAELTLPGFLHDVCSSVHPLAAASPFFRSLPALQKALEFVHPTVSVAHPFDDGTAALLLPSLIETADTLGSDGRAYVRLFAPLVEDWPVLFPEILQPLGWPRHPVSLARFGLRALRSARGLCHAWFRGDRARALIAGLAAHSCLPLEGNATAAFALVLGAAGHAVGWPIARGGSQTITDALVATLESLSGRLVTDHEVRSLDELTDARAVLCDLTPRQIVKIAAARLPAGYRKRLQRYRYGPGVFKMDWALECPIPWRAAGCDRTATVHLGGTLEEIAASERAVWEGTISDRPFVILAQPSLFDPSRAPSARHTAWAYCHVPNGSSVDAAERIESQIERFAPGFRDRVLARHVMPPAALEKHNANLVGGDINGGAQDLPQMFLRPTIRAPYTTPLRHLYICSSSTPPGGGVHGMCGHNAARAALRRSLGGDSRVAQPGT